MSLGDALDLLLDDYLEHLAAYQSARAVLHAHLQQGYLDLARAKLAIGPARVGSQSYDFATKHAQLVVNIAPASASSSPAAVPPLTWAVVARTAAAASPRSEPVSPSAASALRQRRSSSSAPPRAPTDADPDPYAGADGDGGGDGDANAHAHARRASAVSPLAQFSPLPPPSLRASAGAFTDALTGAARVIELERGLRERARAVKSAKRELRRAAELRAVSSAGEAGETGVEGAGGGA
ncbi:hypothetical protein JCM3770_000371 [Rhodotorula araucariae]